jgi:DNA polymerase-3 subunit alpha
MMKLKSNIPFVGLHAHSGIGSPFDGLGYPQEHMDFAYENGSDALALTDHGNMNGMAYQVLHAQKMKEQGKNFKPIFGVEAYFLPNLHEWRQEYNKAKENKKNKIDTSHSGTTIENESVSKQAVKNILNRRRHLILLAQNQVGLNNIFSLVSKSFSTENFYRFPRVDYKLLRKHNEGVIAASACLGGVYAGDYWENRDKGPMAVQDAMSRTTLKMMEIFGDRWYGELQWNSIPEQHELNKYIIQVATKYGIGLISTADSHYPSPQAWKDRELYKRLGWLGKGNLPEWLGSELPQGVQEIGYELYPKNGDQIWDSYKQYSAQCGVEYEDAQIRQSIEETYKIAHNRIESFMPDSHVRLPDFVVPTGMTATQALARMCVDGLRTLGLHGDKKYVDRLREELEVIDDRGFSKYFLTMNAIADKANEVQLTGPGRGSAAGSLVAYVLGITQIDPIKYNLLFSRFLRRDAKDYPDIDYDVSDPMVLKELLIEEWGKSTVVPISNFNTLKLRSLIKDVSKFYGIPFTEVNSVTSKMMKEATPLAKKKQGIKTGVYNPTFEEVMEYSSSLQGFLSKYPHVANHINVLHGQLRSVSRHAGGIVVGEDLDRHMPLINSGGIRQTPWSEGQNVRHLETMGFIKFDVLGLSTLKMIEGAIGHILKRHHGIESPTFEEIQNYYNENIHPDKIDLADSQVYANIFHKGKWAGIFQFTEAGAQSFCKKAKPKNIINIAAITAIYRPGPLGADVDKLYVEAKENPNKVKYENDIVKEITKETYGFLIFQEQIALLAHTLGKDISLDEANKLRKLLTKKGTGEVADQKTKIKLKFVAGCLEKGMTERSATALWKKFEYFSGYGFNKSHAVSYSILSYQCAWLFNYYPSEWMAAFLDKEPESRKEKAINLAKKFKFDIQSIDVNKSGAVWEIAKDNDKSLIQPLTSLKGLGEKAIEQIIENRPFNTIEEFLFSEEISYSKLNKKALDVLARSGALDSLIDDRFSGAKHFWAATVSDRPKSQKRLNENIEVYRTEGEFSAEEKIENLVSLTGIFPMELVLNKEVQAKLKELCVPPLGAWDNDLKIAWFVPREVVPKKTKNGRDYWIIKVIDSTSTTNSIKCWGVNPKKDVVHINRPYASKGLDYSEQWGFSVRHVGKLVLLG